MRLMTAFLIVASLAGCAQYDATREANLAAAAQERTSADDAACRSSTGAQPGSPAYDDCRKRYQNQHAQESHRQSDLANQMLDAHTLRPPGQ